MLSGMCWDSWAVEDFSFEDHSWEGDHLKGGGGSFQYFGIWEERAV